MKPGTAKFSEPDRLRRFELIRDWSDELPGALKTVNFIMLNPSTADEHKPDPTITRCIRYARDNWEGFSRLVATNLIPTVQPYTGLLPRWSGIDMENRECLQTWMRDADLIVVGWGVHDPAVEQSIGLARHIAEFLKIAPANLHCIKTAKRGAPRHPSRAPYTKAAIPWEPQSVMTLAEIDPAEMVG